MRILQGREQEKNGGGLSTTYKTSVFCLARTNVPVLKIFVFSIRIREILGRGLSLY